MSVIIFSGEFLFHFGYLYVCTTGTSADADDAFSSTVYIDDR